MLGDAMGICAEKSARECGATRETQDAYAIESYARVSRAWEARDFDAEIVAVGVPQRRGAAPLVVNVDEEFKRLVAAKVPTLPAAFVRDGTGTITAANASSLNDGAASLVVVGGETVKTRSLRPLAKILGYAEGARAPVDFTASVGWRTRRCCL